MKLTGTPDAKWDAIVDKLHFLDPALKPKFVKECEKYSMEEIEGWSVERAEILVKCVQSFAQHLPL